mmetsp:Transcript_23797/g.43728  ORF Transcript_23797/g.43728 Transcript_23797/m.43728 type:complete len:251 (+) Transcript_23797:129-881(+)
MTHCLPVLLLPHGKLRKGVPFIYSRARPSEFIIDVQGFSDVQQPLPVTTPYSSRLFPESLSNSHGMVALGLTDLVLGSLRQLQPCFSTLKCLLDSILCQPRPEVQVCQCHEAERLLLCVLCLLCKVTGTFCLRYDFRQGVAGGQCVLRLCKLHLREQQSCFACLGPRLLELHKLLVCYLLRFLEGRESGLSLQPMRMNLQSYSIGCSGQVSLHLELRCCLCSKGDCFLRLALLIVILRSLKASSCRAGLG